MRSSIIGCSPAAVAAAAAAAAALLPAEQLLPIAAATATTDSIYSACVFLVALNSAQSHLLRINGVVYNS